MLTREFKQTVVERMREEPEFKDALLQEALNEFLHGHADVARSMLRDYVNATVSFQDIANELNINTKSLQRMLGPRGNPTMESLAGILSALQHQDHVKLSVVIEREG